MTAVNIGLCFSGITGVHGMAQFMDNSKDILQRISVVEKNVQVSNNTKKVSSNMADITGKLLEMVE